MQPDVALDEKYKDLLRDLPKIKESLRVAAVVSRFMRKETDLIDCSIKNIFNNLP